MAINFTKIKGALQKIKPKRSIDYKKLSKSLPSKIKLRSVRPAKTIRRHSTSYSEAKKNILMADDSFFKN